MLSKFTILPISCLRSCNYAFKTKHSWIERNHRFLNISTSIKISMKFLNMEVLIILLLSYLLCSQLQPDEFQLFSLKSILLDPCALLLQILALFTLHLDPHNVALQPLIHVYQQLPLHRLYPLYYFLIHHTSLIFLLPKHNI